MNRRGWIATVALVSTISFAPAALGAVEDEQWMASRDSMRMTYFEDAPHAIVMEDVPNENTVYSYLYGETSGSTDADFERYICKSTTDGPCKTSVNFSYNSILPTCQSTSDLDCVVGVTAISDSGKESVGKFERYSSPNHPNNFPADQRLGIPQGVTGGIWSISDAPHAFGNDYVIYARISGSVNNLSGPKLADNFELSARIVPVSVAKTTKRDVIWGCVQDKTLSPTYKANTRCGPFYDSNEGFRCVGPSGDNNDACLSPHAFPANTRFKLSIRFRKQPLGWIHGRLIDPNISITKDVSGYLVKVEANPAKIPSFAYAAKFSELPANVQSFWENVDQECGSSYCGYRSANNYSAPMKSQSTSLATLNYGKQALEAIKLYLPLIKDTAAANPSSWSWRTLSQREMSGSNNCFTDGVGVKGVVTTNASAYSAGPPTFTDGELKYQVAAPHFQADGKVFKGDYTLVIDSKVARCIYKFSSAPINATISVVNDKGEQSIATTSVSESDGWLKLVARNFEFSAPSISVKLSQESQVNTNPSSPNNVTTNVKTQTNTTQKSPPRSITCTKGKTIKKVTGANPKCPVGYRLK